MNEKIKFAPELKLLEGNVKGTPEGEKTAGMEAKRTRLSMNLLKWVLAGKYAEFTACQNDAVKLRPESFAEIQQYTRKMIKTDDDIHAMMAYLVINDLGKVVPFIDKIEEELNLQSVDHDELLYEGLRQKPELSETFSSLAPKYQNLILDGLKTKFNMGQMVQSENLPVHLVPLTNVDYDSFYFYMIHVLFDIGGAAGHVRDDGSIIITEAYWKNFKAASDEIFSMIAGKATHVDAYNNYHIFRAKMLGLEFSDITVVKLCNMLRVNSEAEAKMVKEAYDLQPIQIRELLNKEFSKTGLSDAGILLYYSPATLSNAVKYFKDNSAENAIKSALDIILPVFATILAQTTAQMSKDGNAENCIAFIADVAEKAKKPLELQDYSFELTKVNSDYRVNCKKKRA